MSRPGLLVTGAPRSGTTFVGRMLALPRSIGYLDEPFNVQIGMTWVPRQFVSAAPTDGRPDLDRAVARLLSGRATFRQTPFHTGTGAVARAGRSILGSRAQLRYRIAAAQPWVRRWLLKDPIACFVAERLHVRHAMPVVVVVRHPAAVVSSYRRLGWRFGVDDLPDVPPSRDGTQDEPAVEGARLWTAIYAHLGAVADRHEGVLVVRHEDLCSEPVLRFRELYAALDLRWTARIERAVIFHTTAENPAQVSAAHVLRRDSRSLATAGRDALADPGLEPVHQVTARVASRWYDDTAW